MRQVVIEVGNLVPPILGKPFSLGDDSRLLLQFGDLLEIPLPEVVVPGAGDDLRGQDPAFGILDRHHGVVVDSEIDRAEPEAWPRKLVADLLEIEPLFQGYRQVQFPTPGLMHQRRRAGGVTLGRHQRRKQGYLAVDIGSAGKIRDACRAGGVPYRRKKASGYCGGCSVNERGRFPAISRCRFF